MGNSILFNTAGALALAVNYVIQGPYSEKFITKQAVKTLQINSEFFVRVDDAVLCIDTDVDVTEADLDVGSVFSVSTTYYLYACHPLAGSDPAFVLSLNSTYPSGYTADTSRKIGGFNTGVSAEINESSIWDLRTTDIISGGVIDANVAPGANISASKLNLTQVMQRGESTLQGSAGRTIAINAVVDTDYHVFVEIRAESGLVGEISIENKTTNAFVVKNSGSDVTTVFGWILEKF